MSHRDDKLAAQLKKLIAEFINRQAGKQSLITVTDLVLSDKTKRAKALVSVLPESQEESAVHFARRQRTELKKFIQSRLRIGHVPHIDFELDLGEKHRQRIDSILGTENKPE